MRAFIFRWSSLIVPLLLWAGCGQVELCGNGEIDPGEACDDGNLEENDGCSAECRVEAENCNDGIDNNGDGLADCEDPVCANNVFCSQAGDCTSPQIVNQNSNTSANNSLGEDLHRGSCDTGSGGKELVFQVTSTVTGRMTLTMLSDVDLILYARTSCESAASELDCADSQAGGSPETFAIDVFAGEDIFIFVDGFSGAEGTFTLTVQTQALQPEVCNDNIDNDLDGATDCLDTDCSNNALCQGGGGVTVIDFGPTPLNQTRSFDLPSGALGFTILIEGDPGVVYGVSRLVKPNGTVLINNFNSNSLILFPTEKEAALVMPQNDRPENAMLAGPWQFRVDASQNDTPNVKVIIRNGPFAGGDIALKIYIPQGLRACQAPGCNGGQGTVINAANAATFAEIQGALNTFFDEFYGDEGGFSQGNVSFFDISSSFLEISSQAELDSLNRQSAIGGPGGLHFFLIQRFGPPGFDSGTAGISSGIPGAITTAGGPAAGVAVEIQGDTDFNGNFTGLTMAHEAGHFLGLFHTTEFNGFSDLITDTPACSANIIQSGNLGACPDRNNMMFPSLLSAMQVITPRQVDVLHGGPIYQ